MQISPINNFQPCFRNVYIASNNQMTPEQSKLIDEIVSALREPSAKFKNKSAETYYKKKKGVDFYIKPCNNMPDSVFLEGLKSLKINKTNNEDYVFNYKNYAMIGIYNNNNPFKIDDVKSAVNVITEQNAPYILPIFASLIALCSYIGMKFNDSSKQVGKPLIETIDTISDKTNTVISDSTAINKMFLKPIK